MQIFKAFSKYLFSFFQKKILYLFNAVKYCLIKLFSSRIALLLAVLIAGFCVIVGRLFYLQIVKSQYYTQNFTAKAEKTISVDAARGNIYDTNGNPLAYNEIGYSVVMTDEVPSGDDRGDKLNGIIYNAINIIESNGDSIIDDFNIELDDEGNYVFKEDPQTRQITFLVNIFGMTSDEIAEEGYDKYTADELMEYLCGEEKYDLDEKYTKEDCLKIVTIRYALSLTAYQKYMATTISYDINDYTMAAILESTEDLTGVEVQETYKRVYNNAKYFSHILGYTGEISEDELKEYNLENLTNITYSIGDKVGKSGIEQTYDAYLQGKKGEKKVFVDSTGKIIETISEKKSESGNDIYLTIDSELQIAAYDILEKKLAACLINKIVNYDYVATEKQNYVYIPIKDVYYQILTNIVDYNKFSDDDATSREKNTLSTFEKKRKNIMDWIEKEFLGSESTAPSELSEEQGEYIYYIYEVLTDEGILSTDLIDTEDEIYTGWINDEITFREFLQHAIAENWIDVTKINSTEKYSNSDELYEEIVNAALEKIPDNDDFIEKIYYYLIYNGDILPYDICMMLYDQEILEKDDLYTQLSEYSIDTYTFVISSIENLTLTPAMIALDPCSGALCITDSDTGDVLALVSYPSYDNNKLSGSVDSEYWYELTRNDSQPLFNYATSALTAPGSTFKLCTSVAGLAEDYIDTETAIYDAVYFDKISPSPKCYVAPASHGTETLSTALRDSCNYFYFQIGYDMSLDEYGEYNSAQGLDIISDYAVQLGLGVKSGIEITEVSPRVSTTDSVRTAIGQGTNGYAVVHLTRYVNTVANSGDNYKLTLLDHISDKEGYTVLQESAVISNKVELEQNEWDAIHTGMRLVTTSGTASSFFNDLETSVAGKTGTAEENAYRSNHAAFVGYAPYEKPEISFACQIRNCDSTSYPGGVLSEVLQYYFGETTLEEVLSKPVENNIEGFHSE